jgi:hypothetical protein
MHIARREQLKSELRQIAEQTLDARVDRYLEIDHHGITGAHHFAPASAECIDLYRDAYFMSAVMVSQSVNESIIRFVAERNGISRHQAPPEGVLSRILRAVSLGRWASSRTKKVSDLVDECCREGVLTNNSGAASKRIIGSFRADVHHLNPKVASIDLAALAKRNLQDLAVIEKDIFGVNFKDDLLDPHHPQYWDVRPDGTVGVFLRL